MKNTKDMGGTIFLYSNQPVVRVDGRYYARMVNFIDFLAEIAMLSSEYRIIVPCSDKVSASAKNWAPVQLKEGTIEVKYYEGNRQAVVASFVNAIRIRTWMRIAVRENKKVVVAGPGPNSFLFWLSLISPRSVKFVFFIRGDTFETVKHIYRGHFLSKIIRGMVRLFRYRINYLLRNERAIVFTYGEKLRSQYPHRPFNVHVITPLIRDAFVRKEARPDIKEGLLKVLYVGRFSEEKNVLALIDAVRLALRDGMHIRLSIVGFGPLENEIRRRIEDSGFTQHIVLHGYIPSGASLVSEYDRNDVFCLPSRTEGIPRAVIEAFARGMPVLATRVGSLPVYFPNEIRFIDGMEAADIKDCLAWCYVNRRLLSSMGKSGWELIGRFVIGENARRVHGILRKSF